MSYTPPSGSSVGFDFVSDDYIAPPAESVTLEFDPDDLVDIRQAGGIPSPIVDEPTIRNQRDNIYVSGIPPPNVPAPTVEKVSQKVYPPGIESSAVPSPQFIYNQVVSAPGISAPDSYVSVDTVRLLGGYLAPPGSTLILDSKVSPYSPPPASSVILEFGSEGLTQVLGASVGDASSVPSPTLSLQEGIFGVTAGDTSSVPSPTVTRPISYITPQGISAPAVPTNNTVTRQLSEVFPTGIAAPAVPTTTVVDFANRSISVPGIAAPVVGNGTTLSNINAVYPTGIPAPTITPISTINNYTRYVYPTGITAPAVSTNMFVRNVVRHVNPPGISAPVPDSGTVVYNEFTISPFGIPAPAVSDDTVVLRGLRYVYPTGISAPIPSVDNVVYNEFTISPPGISAPVPAGTTVTKEHRDISPPGISAPLVNNGTYVENKLQILLPPSLTAPVVATTTTVRYKLEIFPISIPSGNVGTPTVEAGFSGNQTLSPPGISAPVISGTVVVLADSNGQDISESCYPEYEYSPTSFVSGATVSQIPSYFERRSRLTTNGLFFRSKNQGVETNLISVSLIGTTFSVYVDGVVTETYLNVVFGAGSIAALRTRLLASNIIQMPALGVDVNDDRLVENDGMLGGGVSTFPITSLVGGSGLPIDAISLAAIRTGPSRTIASLQTSENNAGSPSPLYAAKQWNGSAWISYSNQVQGVCPI